MKKTCLALLVVFFFLCVLGAPASGQLTSGQFVPDQLASGAGEVKVPPILEIRLSGLDQVDSSVVLNSFGIAPGAVFNFEIVRKGVRSLYSLGYFADIWVEAEQTAAGIVLTLVLTENPRVVGIELEGVKGIDEKTLKEKLTLKENDFLNQRAISAQKDTIVTAYQDEGYPMATVSAVTTQEKEKGRVVVTFGVDEGKKVRVKRVDFSGNRSIGSVKLRKQMDTKIKSWWRGGKFKQETLDRDLEQIVKYYQSQGFRDAKILDHQLSYSKDKRDLVIGIGIEEGPPYLVGNTEWSGNSVVSTEDLKRLPTYKNGDRYDIEKIEKTLSDVYSVYAEHGYIFVNVDKQESVDGAAVNIRFSIEENEPSFVRHVLVEGNDRTKEKVIRRELTVKPGQPFKRSVLMRSQRDVYSLGYFEDVIVDYQVNQPPDIDLIFKIKEKQTGTATAGVGFTSDAGLTGYVELGHNNLFGNGQSVTLHLEKGAKRTNLNLSFTEPWFRDTHTSLGADIYNLQTNRDLYDEYRKGCGVRVGRPIPWIDYSAGYVSYTLEDITLDDFSSSYTGDLDEVDWPQRTSMIETAFIRNSTDSPFYPSKGSKFTLNSEFTGGPLGGDQDFHKHTIDLKWYHKVYWKTALLVRPRLGVMDSYRRSQKVPSYDRFRLGGTTVDFLRGYSDYEVVPDKNVRYVDGTIVRWPGGRLMSALTLEYQFPVADPLHALFFLDVGATWNNEKEIDFSGFKKGAGFGVRIDIPMLGQVGFDYGYGFDRIGGGKWEPHFIMGRLF
ncbi:MAG: outer membrane protein assembly factor BamA [Candidatus Eisenbacteria bacterium]|nr:outer membrane protein assembly factor BamA [Candidatus Eisenbacteria bacterium]